MKMVMFIIIQNILKLLIKIKFVNFHSFVKLRKNTEEYETISLLVTMVFQIKRKKYKF